MKRVVFALLFTAPLALAADEKPANPAGALAQQFVAQIRQAQSLQVRIDADIQSQEGPFLQANRENYALAWESPDKLGLLEKTASIGPSVACDGKKVSGYFPSSHTSFSIDVPANFSDLLNDQNFIRIIGKIPFIDLFIFKDGLDELAAAVQRGQDLGMEKIGGQECRIVQFNLPMAGRQISWKMWLSPGPRPLLRKLQPELSGVTRETFNASWTFSNWQVDGKIAPEAFQLTIPEDTLPAGSEPHPLRNLPAPPLKLDLLDGGQMDLAQHRGKDVVVLDFWATTCMPCLQAMPVIEKTVGEFPAGVALYAVNLGEGGDPAGIKMIRSFLERARVKIKVALDKDWSVGAAYHAEKIPQTAVIDKFGTVRYVHVGIGYSTASALRAEIAGLLAEKTAPLFKRKNLDLAPLAVKFSPAKIKAGEKLTAQIDLENRGADDLPAGAALVQLVAADAQLYLGANPEKIPAGQKLNFKIPAEIWYLVPQKAGKYPFELTVDPDEKLAETNENNNVLRGTLEVN